MLHQTDLNIRSVLFATDLSDSFGIPLRYAARIAARFKAKLFLVHVVDAFVANPMSSLSSELRDLAISAKTELKRISESVLAAEGVSAEVLVRSGNVCGVIFELQRECNADLIVVSSTGKKPGPGKARSSVSEAILRSMPCMVLAVGPEAEERPYPGATVLFPTDLSPRSLDVLPMAVSVASVSSATLILLYVHRAHAPHMLVEQQLSGGQKLKEIASSIESVPVKIEQSVREGAVADGIVSFAKERGVSCIVMNVHRGDLDDGTRLHGVVADVIREAHCPVLTVP